MALIYHPYENSYFKFIYGTAFRPPNFYELYYSDGTTQEGNPGLKPETIGSYELIWEQFIGKCLRSSVSIFHNNIDDLISLQQDHSNGLLIYENSDEAIANGIELELDGKFPSGVEGSASYVLQRAEDARTGNLLVNSPENQAKLKVNFPLIDRRLLLGGEFLYMGSSKTLAGRETGNPFIVNVTLSAPNVIRGLRLTGGVYNLFNQKYADPGSLEHIEDVIRQDGISFRLKATYSFW